MPLQSQHCYCRLLDRLINVWAYHSLRRMFVMDPKSGSLTEVHPLESRVGPQARAWVSWFDKIQVRAMEEDRAEEADESTAPDQRGRGKGEEEEYQRWLWPHLGEVQWTGSMERERMVKVWLKGEREKKRQEKHARMRLRYKQTELAKGS